jgi:CRP-like cAMP-binding protein
MNILGLFRDATNAIALPAGDTLFRKGDLSEVMYVILEGELDVLAADRLVDTIGPGGLVGEMGLIGRQGRSASAVARTDCKLVPIGERHFRYLVHLTPGFAFHLMEVMACRLRRCLESPVESAA